MRTASWYDDPGYIDSLWRGRVKLFSNGKPSEVVFRNEFLFERLCGLRGYDYFINYGCGYGWLEDKIAGSFPSMQVVGIDKAEITRRNNETFSEPNLMFWDKCFEDVARLCSPKVIFCFCNVLHIFDISEVRRMFGLLAEYGCGVVLIWEPANNCLVHNYPVLLKDAGFDVRSVERHDWKDTWIENHRPVFVEAHAS